MDTVHIRYTDAPEAYDYWYVRTLEMRTLKPRAPFVPKGKTWRKIEVQDLNRFNGYQVPRYDSGLHFTSEEPPPGWDDAEHHVPPTVDDLTEDDLRPIHKAAQDLAGFLTNCPLRFAEVTLSVGTATIEHSDILYIRGNGWALNGGPVRAAIADLADLLNIDEEN